MLNWLTQEKYADVNDPAAPLKPAFPFDFSNGSPYLCPSKTDH